MEDLRDLIPPPKARELKSKAQALGIQGHPERYSTDSDALLRQHLFLGKLIQLSEQVWADLRTQRHANYYITDASMRTIPAILTSTIVRGEIGIQCKDDWFINSFLCACCDLYEEMAEW